MIFLHFWLTTHNHTHMHTYACAHTHIHMHTHMPQLLLRAVFISKIIPSSTVFFSSPQMTKYKKEWQEFDSLWKRTRGDINSWNTFVLHKDQTGKCSCNIFRWAQFCLPCNAHIWTKSGNMVGLNLLFYPLSH
jgi:hypothetical protein